MAPPDLSTLPLFAGLTAEEIAQLTILLHRTQVAAGTTLMTAEHPGEVAYLILTGTIKVHVEQADGRDVLLAILGPGALVGELSLLDKQPRSASAVTLEPATLYWIDRVALQAALQRMPMLTYNLASLLARRLRLANVQIQALATQDVFGRVARQVLAFAEQYGTPTPEHEIVIPLRLTQSDFASLVGASRARVNQVLSYYQQQRYLSIHRNFHMTIHNPDALTQRCQ